MQADFEVELKNLEECLFRLNPSVETRYDLVSSLENGKPFANNGSQR